MRFIVILAVLILVALALEPVVRGWWTRRESESLTQGDELVKDPVCQTYVVVSRAITREWRGVTRHFCSPECALRYERDRERA